MKRIMPEKKKKKIRKMNVLVLNLDDILKK